MAVAGYAVADGLELALWCDLWVAGRVGCIRRPLTALGVQLIDGGSVRLPRLIGTSRAMDMILTVATVEAQRAAAIGLANLIVPNGQVLSIAQEFAAQLPSFPQVCCAATGLQSKTRKDLRRPLR
jgi:enoyl-CoA hydratase